MKHARRKLWKNSLLLAAVMLMTAMLAACASGDKPEGGDQASKGTADSSKELRKVRMVLDWTPNTNHTGLYVAKEQGYFAEQGLEVEIIQPSSGGADMMVASGEIPFGVSVQENITQARSQGVPLVSLAAVIQHNTSGFAAPQSKNIKSPKDFEGKIYGGWGSPIEEAVMRSIMQTQDADYSKVKSINIGSADYFTAVKKDVDFAWIFYAWTGIEAELRNEPLDMIYVNQFSDKLDYYTPVIVSNEKTIAEDPELVKSFMTAVSKGYNYAIEHPEDAAVLLLKAVPDLNKELVMKSQSWLSPKYKDDAPRWGEQKLEVWENYSNFLVDNGLMDNKIDANQAFTNEFLPEK